MHFFLLPKQHRCLLEVSIPLVIEPLATIIGIVFEKKKELVDIFIYKPRLHLKVVQQERNQSNDHLYLVLMKLHLDKKPEFDRVKHINHFFKHN
jgi:hypothetical protein